MGKISLEGYVCERCWHVWRGRGKEPRVCPKCFPPNTIISGDYKQISEFDIGDSVFSLSGKISKVKKIFNHRWEGELIEIKASGCLPIQLTPEHKIFRVHCIQKSRSKKRKFERIFLKPELIEAIKLNKRPIDENKNDCGDYLVIPKLKPLTSITKISLKKFTTTHGLNVLKGKKLRAYFPLNRDSAWVLGLYVAEGYASENKGDIIFCLGKHEKDLLKKLSNKIGKSGFKYRIVEEKTAITFHISSRLLERAFREWFGKNAKTKKIPNFILFHKDKKIYESFLKGYIEGDGNYGIVNGKARVNVNTISITLALQLQLLSIKMGDFFKITKTDYSKYHSTYNGRVIKGGVGYLLRASAGRISRLVGINKSARHNKSYVLFDEYIAVPITNIKHIRYFGEVFNLETEDGNYLASNIAVKNCKSPYWNIPRKNKKNIKKKREKGGGRR